MLTGFDRKKIMKKPGKTRKWKKNGNSKKTEDRKRKKETRKQDRAFAFHFFGSTTMFLAEAQAVFFLLLEKHTCAFPFSGSTVVLL